MSVGAARRLCEYPEVMTATEVASVARCSRAAIYRMVEAGQLQAARTSTGGSKTRVMIARHSVAAWLGLDDTAS
jgi:excisionase family DNA binding protein